MNHALMTSQKKPPKKDPTLPLMLNAIENTLSKIEYSQKLQKCNTCGEDGSDQSLIPTRGIATHVKSPDNVGR